MPKSVTTLGKDLYNAIVATGLDVYGAVIDNVWLHPIIGINMPVSGTHKQYQKLDLIVLGAVSYVRTKLLKRGMYLKGTNTGYRIILLSENAERIEAYRQAASRRLSCARILAQSSPPGAFTHSINPLSHIVAMKRSIRKRKARPTTSPAPIKPIAPPTSTGGTNIFGRPKKPKKPKP